jgi:hypothetical protein
VEEKKKEPDVVDIELVGELSREVWHLHITSAGGIHYPRFGAPLPELVTPEILFHVYLMLGICRVARRRNDDDATVLNKYKKAWFAMEEAFRAGTGSYLLPIDKVRIAAPSEAELVAWEAHWAAMPRRGFC